MTSSNIPVVVSTPTLLDQVESLDFDNREKLYIALTKRPEKTEEQLIRQEISNLRMRLVNAEKKIDKKFETIIMMLCLIASALVYFLTKDRL